MQGCTVDLMWNAESCLCYAANDGTDGITITSPAYSLSDRILKRAAVSHDLQADGHCSLAGFIEHSRRVCGSQESRIIQIAYSLQLSRIKAVPLAIDGVCNCHSSLNTLRMVVSRLEKKILLKLRNDMKE